MAVPKLRFKADDGSDYLEWDDFTKLENISAFITKGATPTTYGFDWQPNGVYFFRNDCIKNNVFVYGDYSFIAEEANKFLQRSEVTGGDIVIAITGDIGKVGLIPSEVKKANINQHLARVRIVKDAFPYFVYMYLCSDKVQRTYKKIKTGLSMPQLSLAQIRDTNIPVVSLPEQQKIAEFLSTIDTVIEKQKATVTAWEERKKGVMQKLFNQEVRFKADDGSEFPKWEEKMLIDISQRILVGLATTVTPYYRNSGKPMFRNLNIKQGYLDDGDMIFLDSNYADSQKNKGIHFGDILTVHTGNIGWSCLVPEKYEGALSFTTLITTVRSNIVSNKYVCAFLNSPIGMSQMQNLAFSGGRANLNTSEFQKVQVPIPCLKEQQKIADCLSSLDEVIKKQKATLAAWEELKKGLLQQMFV